MAKEYSRFFDSVEGDRTYMSEDFAEYFRSFLTDGIFNGGTNLKVTADGTGMKVSVDYGTAMIRGRWYGLEDQADDEKMVLDIQDAEELPRIDRVVLRQDLGTARSIYLAVVQGTAAASPIPPVLTRSGNIYELGLAQIAVPAGALAIEAGNVTDERLDASACGLVNSLIQVDTSEMQAEFNTFMAEISSMAPASEEALEVGLATKADVSHTHEQVDITGLGTTLDGKANASHTHASTDLTTAVPVSKGGTGATTAADAIANLGGIPQKAVYRNKASYDLDNLDDGLFYVNNETTNADKLTEVLGHPTCVVLQFTYPFSSTSDERIQIAYHYSYPTYAIRKKLGTTWQDWVAYGSVVYSSTQPTGRKSMIWLKPIE